MATQQEITNATIQYGLKNKKSKKDIYSALISTGQIDPVKASEYLSIINKEGLLDEQESITPGVDPKVKYQEALKFALDNKNSEDVNIKIRANRFLLDVEEKRILPTGYKVENDEVSSIIQNPQTYHDLTPSKKSELLPELTKAGFKFPRKLTSTEQEARIQAESGISSITDMRGEIFSEAGELDRDKLVKEAIPFALGAQELRRMKNDAKDILTRIRTGAALNDSEISFYSQLVPGATDTKESAKYKLDQLEALYSGLAGTEVQLKGKDGKIVKYDDMFDPRQRSEVRSALKSGFEFYHPSQFEQVYGETIKEGDPALTTTGDDQSGQIDQNTGMKVGQGTPTAPETKDEQGVFGRFFSAAAEQIPELAGELGTRLKNIWTNVSEQSTQAKDRSIFENVLRGQETLLRNLGEVGGAVGDVAGAALELAYDTAISESKRNEIKQTASSFMSSPEAQPALQALQGGIEKWDEFKQNNPNIAKDLEAAFNIVTALPLGKGMGIAGKEAKALVGDVAEIGARTLGKDVAEKTTSDIFRAIKPTITVDRNKGTIKSVLQSANQELVDRGISPKNLKEYTTGLADARKSVWNEIEQVIGKSDGLQVNVKTIADEIKSMASSPEILRTDQAMARKLEKIADSLISQGEKISVPDAEALKQFINSELKGTFGKFNLSNVEQNARKVITKRLGEQLDNLLSEIPGEFQSLKNKYGALRQVEDDALKRLVVFERQNPQGLVESFGKISGVGSILKGIVTASPADIVKGAGEIAMSKLQKSANDADLLVKKAFEKLHKRAGEFTPKSKTVNKVKNLLNR